MSESLVVEVGDVRALLRAFQLECEGVNNGTKRDPLLRTVAGFFWPDDHQPYHEADGRSPLGVVLARIRNEVDSSALLSDEERLLLLQRYGLDGAVRRLTPADPTSSLVRRMLSVEGELRAVDIKHAANDAASSILAPCSDSDCASG